jgi:hypothetical protein
MRPTKTLTALLAAGVITAGGIALAPAALAAVTDSGSSDSSSTSTGTGDGERRGPGGHGGPGGPALATILETLDITADELAAAREAGQSLADLAAAQGVETQTLIDALVADREEHLAEHVADGDLTQAEADERLAEVTERITERVEQPIGEGRGGHHGQRGPGGHGGHGDGGPRHGANDTGDSVDSES